MITAFYLLSIIPLLYEMMVFNDTKKYLEIKEAKYKGNEWVAVMILFYFIWNTIGLFTFQWWAFLAIFMLGFIPKKNFYWTKIDAFISLSIILFIILNKYHFHIHLF